MIILFVFCSIAVASSYAQNVIYDNGTTKVYENGVVYCEGGFIEKATEYKSNTFKGLYSSDGKVLVNMSSYTYECYVPNGTECIAKNAFSSCGISSLYIPSSVKYIDPSVMWDGSKRRIIRTYTDTSSAKGIKATEDENTTEVARYTIQGVKINEPQKGINIV